MQGEGGVLKLGGGVHRKKLMSGKDVLGKEEFSSNLGDLQFKYSDPFKVLEVWKRNFSLAFLNDCVWWILEAMIITDPPDSLI